MTLRKQGGSYRGAVSPWMKGGSTEAWWSMEAGRPCKAEEKSYLQRRGGLALQRRDCFMTEARWLIQRSGGSLDERWLYRGVVGLWRRGDPAKVKRRVAYGAEVARPYRGKIALLHGGEVTLRKQGGSYRGEVAPWMQGSSMEAWWLYGGRVTLQRRGGPPCVGKMTIWR